MKHQRYLLSLNHIKGAFAKQMALSGLYKILDTWVAWKINRLYILEDFNYKVNKSTEVIYINLVALQKTLTKALSFYADRQTPPFDNQAFSDAIIQDFITTKEAHNYQSILRQRVKDHEQEQRYLNPFSTELMQLETANIKKYKT